MCRYSSSSFSWKVWRRCGSTAGCSRCRASSSSGVEQLDRLDDLGIGDVAFAKVNKVAAVVEGDVAIFKAFDQLDLVLIALLLVVFEGISFGDLLVLKGFLLRAAR